MLALSGRSDHRLSEALRLHVPSDVTPGPGGLLGLELEFSVRSQGGGRVHFGSLIHRLPLDGSALDPGDPNAYRCSWGGVITSDGAEAEIATPPVRTRPGFAGELQAWAETGEAELRRAVPRGIELCGYSAHLSAAMPAGLNDRVCRLYAETFAADLMLLMDRADSPGLLVRPRPGRTELCGEFIQRETLPAAAAFVAGTTKACAAAVRSRGARIALPPRLTVRLARAVHRYGWYVDRSAFGPDLHAASRRALLPRAAGGTISAQSHLELAWASARQALADDAIASDMQAAEAMVTGSLPLPAERGQPGDPIPGPHGGDIWFTAGGSTLPRTPAPPLCAHVRPGFTLRPVMSTWDFTVFEASGPARTAYACVPRTSLPGFIDELDAGVLDDAIAGYLALPSRGRVLSAHQQTRRLGVYDRMGAPAGLLAPERDPQTGHYESAGRSAKRTFARPGKRNRQEHAAPKPACRFVRKAAVIGVGVAVLLAGAGVAAAVHSHRHGSPRGTPSSGPTAPAMSFKPRTLSFHKVRINTSVPKSLTMTNTGRTPVAVKGIRVTGPARDDFSVPLQDTLDAYHGQAVQTVGQPRPCLRRLRAGESCNIQVVFTPSAAGPHTADLRIYLTSTPQPQDIVLTGTGIAPNPRVTLSPPALAFGPQTVNTASPSRPIVVRAAGNAPVTLASVAVRGRNGQDFSPVRACQGTAITPRHLCYINITFTPGDAGPRSATLVLTFAGISRPATASLSGTGTAVTLAGCSAAPITDTATVSFGKVAIGTQSKPVTVTVQNANAAPCALSERSSGAQNFPLLQPHAVNSCSDHLKLQPHESCVIAVAFYPTAPGSVSGALTVAFSEPAATVALSGLGADESPPTTPTGFQFDPSATQCPPTMVWDPSTDNVGVLGYNVYKNGNFLITVNGTTYTDPKEFYTDTYAVAAVDAAGNLSAETPSISRPAICG